MLVVAIASKRLRLFPGIYSVNRTTWGEILFPVGVWLSAYFTPSPWIFMAAVLHMSLADGFAAIIGVTFGKKHHYQLFGQYKTLLGSLTFWAMSMGITFAVVSQSSVAINDTTLPLLLALPVTATLAENFSPYGTDNVTVPMLVLTFLTYSKLLS
jgi:phytol kinase